MRDFSQIANQGPVLRAVLRTVSDAMIIIDQFGVIQVFNPVAEKLFGYSEAELIGQNVNILMPSPDRERHNGSLARYLSTGEARIIGIGRIIEGQRRDGSKFPIELSVGDASVGDDIIFVGFIRDLTRRHETEVKLEELHHALAHVSRVSAMGTMASSLAHELNQPLTAIANYVEAARDILQTAEDDTITVVREALNDAAQQAIRAGQIVRRLRDFISRGETEKRMENLRIIINEANALALIGTGEFAIDVVIDIDERVYQVLVDRVQIQQVLVNLIRNAVDSMRKSDVRKLKISAIPIAENMVEVSVTDSGSGIDPDIEASLFDPFASTKASGMGLGLSICQTIVNAHGGRIWHVKPQGSGAAFHFTLQANISEIPHDR